MLFAFNRFTFHSNMLLFEKRIFDAENHDKSYEMKVC